MNYKIIEGRPTEVQKQVDDLRSQGWELNGTLFPRIEDGYHLVVQGLYREVEQELEADNNTVLTPVKETLMDLVAKVTGETNEK